jgi:hypothetical protein
MVVGLGFGKSVLPRLRISSYFGWATSHSARHKGDHQQDQEDEEDNLRDTCSGTGYAGKAQRTGYQCDNEKEECPA